MSLPFDQSLIKYLILYEREKRKLNKLEDLYQKQKFKTDQYCMNIVNRCIELGYCPCCHNEIKDCCYTLYTFNNL